MTVKPDARGALVHYVKRDLEVFCQLQQKYQHCLAAPVLFTVIAGANVLGGVLYGFCLSARAKTVLVLTERMGLTPKEATLVYSNAYRGFFCEGNPRPPVAIALHAADGVERPLFYPRVPPVETCTTILDIGELVRRFLCALDKALKESK